MARFEEKVKAAAPGLLEDGEVVLASIVARPRGAGQAISAGGGVASELGRRKAGRNKEAAGDAGFPLANPMALVVTDRRLVSLAVSAPILPGLGGKVKALAGAVPIIDVDSIEVKRLPVGKRIIVTIRGTSFTLEAGAGSDAAGVVQALEQAKSAA